MIAKPQHSEPGVIPTLKVIITTAWVLLTLGLRRAIQQDPANYYSILNWVWSGFLCLLLWVKPLETWLKKWYLPLVIAIATLGPMVSVGWAEFLSIRNGVDPVDMITPIGLLSIWLILPVMIMAMQFSVVVTIGYIGLITILPLMFVLPHLSIVAMRQAHFTQAAGRFFILGIAGFIVARLSKAQRKQRDELAQKNVKLAQYASTLETLTITRERNRLARELHDTLAHTLSAVNVQLQALEVLYGRGTDAVQVTEQIQKTRELTRTGLEEARRALHNLRASPVEELGLSLAIKRAVELAAQRGGFQAKLEASAYPDNLPAEMQQQIYRIVEEALNNVVRHAQAQHLTIRFRENKAKLILLIEDDGVGFPAQKDLAGHFGLIGMRERAHLMGGELTVRSAVGRGTRVEFIYQLPEEIG